MAEESFLVDFWVNRFTDKAVKSAPYVFIGKKVTKNNVPYVRFWRYHKKCLFFSERRARIQPKPIAVVLQKKKKNTFAVQCRQRLRNLYVTGCTVYEISGNF